MNAYLMYAYKLDVKILRIIELLKSKNIIYLV